MIESVILVTLGRKMADSFGLNHGLYHANQELQQDMDQDYHGLYHANQELHQDTDHEPTDYSKRIFVKNFPYNYRELDLHRLFRPFGEVTKVEIIYNLHGSKGYGFVTMRTSQEAMDAMHGLRSTVIGDRILEVNEALPKRRQVRLEAERLMGRCRCGGLREQEAEVVPTLELINAEIREAEATLAVLRIKQQMMLEVGLLNCELKLY